MSFRLKIFLSCLLFVAVLLAATLWLAEASLSGAFEQALNARYEEQAHSAKRDRDLREVELRTRAGALASSRRVSAAFLELNESDDVASATEQLLVNLRDELFKPGAVPSTDWSFQAFGSAGNLLRSSELPLTPFAEPWPPDARTLRAAMESHSQVSGLLASQDGQIWEAVFQGISDEVEGLSGGLLVARPRPMVLEGADATGLELGKRWFGTFEKPDRLPDHGEVKIKGVPYLVFARALESSDLFPRAREISAYSLAEKQQQQKRLRLRLGGTGLVAIVLAGFVALALAHGLSMPIRDLVKATRSVRSGDLSQHAPVRRRDELGRFVETFNEMIDDLALKEKYRTVLDVVSDPQVAQALMDGGLELGGEEREVSVIFCDIRGFTTISEGMAPAEVIAMLNDHFTPLNQVVHEHGGVILQYAGDLIMALFGAPSPCPDHAKRAAQCALAMIARRRELNEESPRPIEMGIGVATGGVVAGRMGGSERLNYSVVGAKVNLAARLCAQAAAMKVIVDHATIQACEGEIGAKPLGALKLKGFTEEFQAYEIGLMGF